MVSHVNIQSEEIMERCSAVCGRGTAYAKEDRLRLLTFCCICGHNFGRSGDGTRTETHCPRCGAQVEYAVENTTVTVRLVSLSVKQQAARLKKRQGAQTAAE